MDQKKRKSKLQERRTAKDTGGSVQPGSGAPAFYKSDVRKIGESRVECKTTGSKSYALKLTELEKIKAEAIMGGAEDWAFQVEYQQAIGSKRFAVIDWQEYLDLKELQKRHETLKSWQTWVIEKFGDALDKHTEELK